MEEEVNFSIDGVHLAFKKRTASNLYTPYLSLGTPNTLLWAISQERLVALFP